MKLTFTEKEFDVLRKFQNRMNAVFGESAYVGTDYTMVMLEYSPKLKAMIRPLAQEKVYNFEVKMLSCEKCKFTCLFLASADENTYVCSNCLGKKKK